MEDDGDNSEPLLRMETKLMTDKGNTEEIIAPDMSTDKNEIIWTKETKSGPGEINWRALGKPHVRIFSVQPEFCRKGGGVESPCQMGCGSYSVNMNHY